MSEEEAKLEHDEIAYGLQPSGEVVLYKNSADMKVQSSKTALGHCCIGEHSVFLS